MKKTRRKEHDLKRAMLRDSLLSMSKAVKTKDMDVRLEFPGFGKIKIDEEKCIGCGACAFICSDGAMTAESKKDKIHINHTYWKCTACGKCTEFCPKECIDVTEEFDLTRFLEGKTERMAKVGLIQCTRCEKSYLPLLLSTELEKILIDRSYASSNLELCPSCRKFNIAERVKATRGLVSAKG